MHVASLKSARGTFQRNLSDLRPNPGRTTSRCKVASHKPLGWKARAWRKVNTNLAWPNLELQKGSRGVRVMASITHVALVNSHCSALSGNCRHTNDQRVWASSKVLTSRTPLLRVREDAAKTAAHSNPLNFASDKSTHKLWTTSFGGLARPKEGQPSINKLGSPTTSPMEPLLLGVWSLCGVCLNLAVVRKATWLTTIQHAMPLLMDS
eukprot:1819542-Amphidinium_carterae.1